MLCMLCLVCVYHVCAEKMKEIKLYAIKGLVDVFWRMSGVRHKHSSLTLCLTILIVL
jgi:hypothetical protein